MYIVFQLLQNISTCLTKNMENYPQENYEDGVLNIIKHPQDINFGLDKIFDGLQKHVKLQNDLFDHFETVEEEHKERF